LKIYIQHIFIDRVFSLHS